MILQNDALHIAVDARFLTHPQVGGFRTYTRELCFALARIGTEHRFTLYVDRVPAHVTDIPHGNHVTVTVLPGTRPLLGMPLREQWGLTRAIRRDRPDVLHGLCNTAPQVLSCPLVVTLHDTLWNVPFAGGSLSRRALHDYTRWAARRAAQRAAAICVPSEYIRGCITQERGVDAGRVFVTPEAAGQAFLPIPFPSDIRTRSHADGQSLPFVLALGSADPRKNLPMLAQAWAQLPETVKSTHTFLTVWANRNAAQEFERLCESLEITQNVIILPAVSEAELATLYREADVFLFPSRAEGFGLPALEAMQCGCPVVASNATSLPEVCGDAALLVDPSDIFGWTAALNSVLTDADLREDLRQRGRTRATLFSWDECARRTLSAYEFARKANTSD